MTDDRPASQTLHQTANQQERELAIQGAAAKAAMPPLAAHRLSGEAKVVALLIEHHDSTDLQIAKAIGCSRTSLFPWNRF